MFSVDALLVTMLAASKRGMLFPPVRTCLTYLAISKPCAHATLHYDTLTGTDRFTLRRAKQVDSRGTL